MKLIKVVMNKKMSIYINNIKLKFRNSIAKKSFIKFFCFNKKIIFISVFILNTFSYKNLLTIKMLDIATKWYKNKQVKKETFCCKRMIDLENMISIWKDISYRFTISHSSSFTFERRTHSPYYTTYRFNSYGTIIFKNGDDLIKFNKL